MSAELPHTAATIAAWLGEDADRIAEVLEWHGAATVLCALEHVDDMPDGERGPRFFKRINEIQERRKLWGEWPRMKYRAWKAGR